MVELDWPVTAPVSVLDDQILLGGADGTLRAFRTDGTEVWRIQLWRPIELQPARARGRTPRDRRQRRPPPVPAMTRALSVLVALAVP